MALSPDCPHCRSHDVRALNAAVTGVSGFRCHDCTKVFYVAVTAVTQRIEEAQAKRAPSDSE
jgi:transposase-like protein